MWRILAESILHCICLCELIETYDDGKQTEIQMVAAGVLVKMHFDVYKCWVVICDDVPVVYSVTRINILIYTSITSSQNSPDRLCHICCSDWCAAEC